MDGQSAFIELRPTNQYSGLLSTLPSKYNCCGKSKRTSLNRRQKDNYDSQCGRRSGAKTAFHGDGMSERARKAFRATTGVVTLRSDLSGFFFVTDKEPWFCGVAARR